MTLLSLKGISKSYGAVTALESVDLELAKGEVIGLVGDNGAGKTTLMKIVSGAIVPEQGAILFDQQQLSFGDPIANRQSGIEMIYQNLSLCLGRTVYENIFLGRELTKKIGGLTTPLLDQQEMIKQAEQILSSLNSKVDVRATVGNLSGGQRQIVAVARAIIFKPKLVIMDEPTAALAVKEVDNVLSVIKGLKSQGISVILISHRLTDILEVSDTIAVMRHGKVDQIISRDKIDLSGLTKAIIG